MKVLHIFPTCKIGGAPLCVLRLIKNSRDKNIHVICYNADNELFGEFEKYSTIHNIDVSRFSISSLTSVFLLFKKLKPDVIHCHGKGGALYTFFLSIFKLIYSFKIFYTLHGFHLKYKGVKLKLFLLFERVFSKIYDQSISVSASEQVNFIKYTKVNSDKNTVIHNGIELDDCVRSNYDDILKEVEHYSYNAVTLSRISPEKDLIRMIRAFDSANLSNVALHIIGGSFRDTNYQLNVEKIINELNISNVFLWGDIPKASSILQYFDFYISTSLFEGLPTSIIEAQMSKLLVVATDCIGNIDLVEDGISGILVKVGDTDSISEGIRYAFSKLNTIHHRRIVDNASHKSELYSITNHVNNINNLYENKNKDY
ncbi:glycosyltransferase [Halosquirtibacter xylanolyticus]|uniref:glycosyltransferase n=1 Tax=Halosquirtibacter xylanolyticus TaxID=3374599 RepID=UPI003747E025|nr:glycosyltransferase [Prolixibacteraceae bacterium]